MIGFNYTYAWLSCHNHTTPTCAPKDSTRRLSVLLLNKYMTDENMTGGQFPWNSPQWHLSGGHPMGYIATDNFTNKHTRCVYPLDGDTNARQDDGCGPMWGSNNTKWCDAIPQDIANPERKDKCFHSTGWTETTWFCCAG